MNNRLHAKLIVDPSNVSSSDFNQSQKSMNQNAINQLKDEIADMSFAKLQQLSIAKFAPNAPGPRSGLNRQ